MYSFLPPYGTQGVTDMPPAPAGSSASRATSLYLVGRRSKAYPADMAIKTCLICRQELKETDKYGTHRGVCAKLASTYGIHTTQGFKLTARGIQHAKGYNVDTAHLVYEKEK